MCPVTACTLLSDTFAIRKVVLRKGSRLRGIKGPRVKRQPPPEPLILIYADTFQRLVQHGEIPNKGYRMGTGGRAACFTKRVN
jgi:hypothetical protein